MKTLKYFLQFLGIIFLFLIFKIVGLKATNFISGKVFLFLGPLFRSNKNSKKNLSKAFPNLNNNEIKRIIKNMWVNYGKIFGEYVFIKDYRNTKLFSKKINIENLEILNEIKLEKKPVIFISGHFNNFELMAMSIEKSGIDLAVIYRPLNNFFLNPIMEKIRINHICKKQVKKGISGTKELLRHYKNGSSIALMIDQRVTEGIKSKFFHYDALTTTIPAQFVMKYNSKIVPVYIERLTNNNFNLKFFNPIVFDQKKSIAEITNKLNNILEEMIKINPDQWIWTHDRWK